MNVNVSFDTVLNTHVFHLAGESDITVFLDALGQVYEEHIPANPLNLIFLDDGLTRYLTPGESMTLMDFARKHRPPCPGRTAMVAKSDVSFGTFRMAEGMGGDFSDHIQVFRSLDEAKDWIGSSEESSGVA